MEPTDQTRTDAPPELRVGVFGAGAIGSVVGLRLAAAGVPVVLLGRQRLVDHRDALFVETPDGQTLRAEQTTRPEQLITVTTRPTDLAEVEICLVTVKSKDTEAAARTLADVLRPDAVVVSLQNGLRNPGVLQAALTGPVSQGVVAFNVARVGEHGLRQTTSGPILVGDLPGAAGERLVALQAALAQTGQRLEVRADIEGKAAAKLLINLNNGICAATGLGIVEALRDRDARWCFGRCVIEGHRVLRAAGLHPGRLYGVPAGLLGRFLSLPDFLVLPFAGRLTRMDESARSSTLQDLDRGRRTEIEDLNGEIVRRAQTRGLDAPANALVVETVRAHERRALAGQPPRFLSSRALRQQMKRRAHHPTTRTSPEPTR